MIYDDIIVLLRSRRRWVLPSASINKEYHHAYVETFFESFSANVILRTRGKPVVSPDHFLTQLKVQSSATQWLK
jgi:hypothetical protein